VHAEAPDAASTDWAEIVGFYDLFLARELSAVALAMRAGPAAELAVVDRLLARGELDDYRLAHAARADFCRRLGKTAEARAACQRALALTHQVPERRFIERRQDLAAPRQRLSEIAGAVGGEAAGNVRRCARSGLYFGTTDSEIWMSRDEGKQWSCIARHQPQIYAVEVAGAA